MEDLDDWDIEDKQFAWSDEHQSAMFQLNTTDGLVRASPLVRPGSYELKFSVVDARHQHRVQSTMRVDIKEVPFEAVINSGSVRIVNINSFQFITERDWRTQSKMVSLREQLEQRLKQIINCDRVHIFSIVPGHTGLDVHYYATENGRYLSPVYINSVVQQDSMRLLLNGNVSQ